MIPYVSFVPGEPMSVTSIRNTCQPEPSIVAVPKIVALVRSF
jgi:hypothetical protein